MMCCYVNSHTTLTRKHRVALLTFPPILAICGQLQHSFTLLLVEFKDTIWAAFTFDELSECYHWNTLLKFAAESIELVKPIYAFSVLIQHVDMSKHHIC